MEKKNSIGNFLIAGLQLKSNEKKTQNK
jgi:hypothetical protein